MRGCSVSSEYEVGYTDGKRDGWLRGFLSALATVAIGILFGSAVAW